MIIVTTPMCKKIVEIAGLKEFKVNKHPDKEEGDLAILLSESKVQMPSIAIKLNTFNQIKESILTLTNYFYENNLINQKVSEDEILTIFYDYGCYDICGYDMCGYDMHDMDETIKKSNFDKKVKVYSEFLKDIVSDLGCSIVDEDLECGIVKNSFDYVVFPDYLKSKVVELDSSDKDNFIFIEIPTHSNASSNPIIRAKERYSILLNNL